MWRQGFRGYFTLFLSTNYPGNRSHQGNSVGVVGEGIGDIAFQVGEGPDATTSHRAPRRSAKAYKFISHIDHKIHKGYVFGTENRILCVLCALCGKHLPLIPFFHHLTQPDLRSRLGRRKSFSHTDHKTHKRTWIWNREMNSLCSMCPLWQIVFNPSSFAALRLCGLSADAACSVKRA